MNELRFRVIQNSSHIPIAIGIGTLIQHYY